jgi:hypothetical protein
LKEEKYDIPLNEEPIPCSHFKFSQKLPIGWQRPSIAGLSPAIDDFASLRPLRLCGENTFVI